MRKPSLEKIAAVFIATAALGLVGLGAFGGPAQGDTADPDLRAEALADENEIARCMTGAGFKYIVALPNDVLVEEARQAAIAAGKEGAELEAVATAAGQNAPADPNEAAVAKLSAAQQAAWHVALMGTDTDGGGCAEARLMASSVVTALNSDLAAEEAAKATAKNDQLVVVALEAYVSCMGSYGYTVDDTEDINELIDDYTEATTYVWPSDLPDVLPANPDVSLKIRFTAANARTAASLAAVDSYTAQAQDNHTICAGWYDNEFERAYNEALNA